MTFDRVRNSVHRRTVLCGGGGAVFGMIVTALIGGNKPAKAAAISGPVPEVDQLLVRSVVDSYQIAVAPSSKVDNVEIQRFGWALSDQPPSRAIASEFGLSMHVVEGETVTPMLLARRFTLNPVLVIISIVFWYWMWGVAGALLAVPLLATLKIICDRIRSLAALGHFLGAEARN